MLLLCLQHIARPGVRDTAWNQHGRSGVVRCTRDQGLRKRRGQHRVRQGLRLLRELRAKLVEGIAHHWVPNTPLCRPPHLPPFDLIAHRIGGVVPGLWWALSCFCALDRDTRMERHDKPGRQGLPLRPERSRLRSRDRRAPERAWRSESTLREDDVHLPDP